MKIFGREPTVIIALIGAVVTLLVAFNTPGISAGAGAAITSAATAVLIALTTRPLAPGLFTAAVSAGAALLAEYQFHLSDAQVGSISGLVLVVFALFGIRPQVTPRADAAPIAPAQGVIR